MERAHPWPLPGLDDIHPYTVLASWAGRGRRAWFPIHSCLEERRGVLFRRLWTTADTGPPASRQPSTSPSPRALFFTQQLK